MNQLTAVKELALSLPGYGNVETPPNIPSGASAPSDVINSFLNLLVVTGIIFALIFLLYGGVKWVMSGGDKGKLDSARRTIMFSIVGLIVMILAFVIIQAVGYLLGSEYLSNFGKPEN